MKIKAIAFPVFSLCISMFASPNAIEISSASDFARIANNPWGAYFLSRDIDFQGRKLDAIDFCGTFDGKNHIISNFEVNSIKKNSVGLFRSIGSGKCREKSESASPLVKNLVIKTDSILGNDYIGSLAGNIIRSSIINVKARTKLRGRNFVGGIAGQIDSLTLLEDVEFSGDIFGSRQLGGIVGGMGFSVISYGYSNSNISGSNTIGGITGSAHNSFISSVISDGAIYGSDTIGGILGIADGEISKLPRNQVLFSRAAFLQKTIERATYSFEPQHRFIRIPEILGDEEDAYLDISDSIHLALRVIGTSTLSHISGRFNIGGVLGVTNKTPWSTVESIFSGTVSGVSKVGKYCGSCELLSPIQLFIDAGVLNCTESCVNPLGNTISDVMNYHNFSPFLSRPEIEYFEMLAKQHYTPYHWFPTDHFGGIYLLQQSMNDSLEYIYIDSAGVSHSDPSLVPAKGAMIANSKYKNRHTLDSNLMQHPVSLFDYPNVPGRPIRKIKLFEGGNSVYLRDKFLNKAFDSLRFSLIGDTACFHLVGDSISMRCCPENKKASTILQIKSWRRFSQNIRLLPVGRSSKCYIDTLKKQ